MIIVSMGCGLGNQMFEYAFLLALRVKYPDVDFKIDSRYMLPQQHNGYELKRLFNIEEKECRKKEVKKLAEYSNENCWYKSLFHLKRKIRCKLGLYKETYFFQRDFTEYYDEVFKLDTSKSYYLHGVWANEKYFESVREKVFDVFTFRQPLNEISKGYQKVIESTLSISIHIRRGDYKQKSKLLLEKDYYDKAIEIMEKRFENIHWFVFSDELEFSKGFILNKNNITYIEGNKDENSWMDMYLMSLCKHNIIANSTFSFWGAYLNKNLDKVVIAPLKPFIGCSTPFVAEGWIAI